MNPTTSHRQFFAQKLLSTVRRDQARQFLEAFGRIYLPKYFKHPPSSMHKEMLQWLQEATRERGQRIAVAAPRGHAKSTLVSLTYVLWSICFKTDPFILIFSSTAGQAEDLLSHLKVELEVNALLQADFPEACELPSKPGGPPRWKQGDIITRSGIRVVALGASSRVRGRRHRSHRPTLMILDDLEGDEHTESPFRRAKLQHWFERAVLKAGEAQTNVVVVGTLLHYDSLLARLIDPRKSPRWRGKKYQAVTAWSAHPHLWEKWESIFHHREEHEGQSGPDAAGEFYREHEDEMLEGTQVLWPPHESYLKLMEVRAENRPAFDAEKQNEPIDPADCLFRDEDFHYWDDQYADAQELITTIRAKGRARIYGACDPSLGKAGRHRDDTAIVTLLRDDKTGILYVVDAEIRRLVPHEIIATIIQYERARSFNCFGVEAVQFQEVLADQLYNQARIEGVCLHVQKIHHTTDKIARIQKLQPLVKMGTIRFSRRHRLLLDQLRQFPKAAHDDGPDALAMAVEVSDRIWVGPQRVGV